MTCYYGEVNPKETGDKGRSYRGREDSTESGKTCLNWLENNPWEADTARDGKFVKPTPDLEEGGLMKWGNGLGNHNYCRNADSSSQKPWCFNTDHKKEDCNVPVCGEFVNFHTVAKSMANTMRSGMSLPGFADVPCGMKDTSLPPRMKFLQNMRMGQTKDGKP